MPEREKPEAAIANRMNSPRVMYVPRLLWSMNHFRYRGPQNPIIKYEIARETYKQTTGEIRPSTADCALESNTAPNTTRKCQAATKQNPLMDRPLRKEPPGAFPLAEAAFEGVSASIEVLKKLPLSFDTNVHLM